MVRVVAKVNKLIGNHFEQEFCDYLAEHGFWAHNMAQTAAGQPADVVAVKDGIGYLIDCKVCENDRFRLSRIEENQETAMTRWELCGNFPGLFALKLTDGSVWMIHLGPLLALRTAGVSSINAEKIRMMGLELERWVKLKPHDRDSWSKTFCD